jgi:hypothetical protein
MAESEKDQAEQKPVVVNCWSCLKFGKFNLAVKYGKCSYCLMKSRMRREAARKQQEGLCQKEK